MTRVKNALVDSLFDVYRFEMTFRCVPLSAPFEDDPAPTEACPLDLSVSEETGDFLNYNLSHCPTGITNVPGYSRIKANNIYSDINYHYYSNQVGFKSYLEIMPGGNILDVNITISGQDTLFLIDSFTTLLTSNSYGMKLPLGIAYTVDSLGVMTLMTWKPHWILNPNGSLSIGVGTYPLGKRLILVLGTNETDFFGKGNSSGNLEWSTFYGGSGLNVVMDIQMDSDDRQFVLSTTGSTDFPTINGYQAALHGGRDAHLTLFDDEHQRVWATYYGGEYWEYPEKLALYDEFVFVVGGTEGSETSPGVYTGDLPMPAINNGIFVQSSFGGGAEDGFIISMDIASGQLDWASYFGGEGADLIWTIDIVKETDVSAGKIAIGGYTQSEDISNTCAPVANMFPGCTNSSYGYNQTFSNNFNQGFIAEFHRESRALVWSTLFGGDGYAAVLDIKSNLGAELIICGSMTGNTFAPTISSPTTPSLGFFPLANPGGGAFFQSTKAIAAKTDAYVAMFDEDHNLVWCTLYGGNENDELVSVEIANGDIYVLGSTESSASVSSCSAQTNGNLPICNSLLTSFNRTTMGGTRDNIILRFDLQSNSLVWSTFVGGNGVDGNDPISYYGNWIIGDLAVLRGHEEYVMMSSYTAANVPVMQNASFYFQSDNASLFDPQLSDDGFIYLFNENSELYWASHFGGGCNCQSGFIRKGGERIMALAASSFSFAIGGETGTENSTTPYLCPATPGVTPFCDRTINAWKDGFVTVFDLNQLNLSIDDEIRNDDPSPSHMIFPNPTKKTLTVIRSRVGLEIQNMDIFTITGSKVDGVNYVVDEHGNNLVDLGILPAGLYILQITDNSGKHSYKISKE